MDELIERWGLWGLFISAFISSTVLPGGSEALLVALALDGSHSPAWLLSVATLGNTLGGMTSWGIGRLVATRFPVTGLAGDKHGKAIARVQRFGAPVLLLSWVPVIGDPLCVAAGWLRMPPLLSMLFICLGKAARYAVLLWVSW